MALYTQDSIERLKQAIDIVELVGARTELRRVGGRYTGLCPFHEERTPSFSVNQELNLFHCFGCQESGDAIGFIQKTEAMDFREAVELLADRYGVELKKENEDPQEEERRRIRERLLGLLERTTQFYERYLWESNEAAPARAYLADRALGEEVLKAYRVGFSPSAWDKVLLAARRDGYTEEELAGTGLGQRGRQGKFYDRFRGRIMFPLSDGRGRVLGFGARAMKEEGDRREGPKYLNTSENSIYHKGRQLFGIDLARASAAKSTRIIVVEGYTDVLALHQAGLPETVAIMGTSLTEEQMAELARAATTVFLALDADRAGQAAMLKAARMAGTRDVELRVIGMPEGRDPAEIVAGEGPDAFKALMAKAMSVPEFEVRRALAAADLSTTLGRDKAFEDVRPLIQGVPDGPMRIEMVRLVADRLNVPDHVVLTSLKESGRRARPPEGQTQQRPPVDRTSGLVSSLDRLVRAEHEFLAMCVKHGKAAAPYLEQLTDDHFSSGAMRRFRVQLTAHPESPLTDLPQDDPELIAIAREIVMLAEEQPPEDESLLLGFLQLELRRIDRALRAAGHAKNYEEQRRLWAEREAVRARMDKVMMGEGL